jgi:hypothetical protein
MIKKTLIGTVILSAVSLLGQSKPADAIPRTADGKPDFSGFWSSPRQPGAKGGGATVFTKEKMAPFKPGGEALFYEPRTGDPRHDEPRAFCGPSGFPSAFFGPTYPIQMVQNKDYVVMVTEFQRATRLIPLDGRAHNKDIEPTYYGDSVGHWEGDILVIDTTNFKRWSLDDYYYVDPKQYRMHSEQFHTIERIQFKDRNTLAYQITIDDPKIFSRPWSEDMEMKYRPEYAKVGLFEFVCEENNRCAGGVCKGN